MKLYRRILPTLASFLAGGKDRYLPRVGVDFEWSNKSWTHNAFRVYELIFGRQQGIRVESTSGVDENGTLWVIMHTFEATVAYTETFLRNAFALPKFRFVKVYLPVLAPVGFGVPTRTPYLFAIAFDTTANGTAGAASSVTYSHTNTGSNLTLTIEGCQNNVSRATSSSATYNAVSATQIVTNSNAAQNTWMDILALANPATGANNVVWTQAGGGTGVGAFSMSLTGTAASPIGASAASTYTGATSKSQAVTTTAANSWIVDNLQCNGSSRTATGSGQTIRSNITGVGGNGFAGSTTTTTTTGSYTVSYSWTGNNDGTLLVAEIKALVASGPTNLKSYNGNVAANIKSIMANLIANIKSLDGNS